MRAMNLRAIDLNLLVVFDAVMQERNVTRAAGRVGLSQPAMSHALGRLRHALHDELFVRTPQGMAPTPRAELLAEPLRNALQEVRLALEPMEFDPATSDRTCRITVNNYAAIVLAPPLVAATADAAPLLRLDLRPSGTLDVVDLLDVGDIDLAIGATESVGERFNSKLLIEDPFVLVMRRGHPAAEAVLSPSVLAGLSHLQISSSGEDTSFLDAWLGERGLARKLDLRAPNHSAAAIIAQSDRVAVLSRRIGQSHMRRHPLLIRELPFASPLVRTVMLWHQRLDAHPAHRWLRHRLAEVARPIQAAHVAVT